jgi:tetratricopeptide (TPR) repeat protein
MKLPALLLIMTAAFITAAAFRYTTTNNTRTETLRKKLNTAKQFSIRCSPLFIPTEEDAIPRLTGWGNYTWKVTTTSDSAQYYFDQGINMYYAFHIIESRASFDKATRFDPQCAMAWWGKALAFGPNINDFGYQRPSDAYPSTLKAIQLITSSSQLEQALIEAMAVRYSDDSAKAQSKLNALYKDAMSKLYAQYNTNADVSALYADALMLIHPWDLYNKDYSPKQWTPEIVAVLKHTLQLNQKHPGANHYFIHAMEASGNPQEAMQSANFLATTMPDVAHVTHMPSHIYIRTGYYNKGIDANDKAIAGYNKYLGFFPAINENIALYDLHNEHMKMNCAQMAGNYTQAMAAAKQVQQQIPSFYLSVPGALGNFIQYVHQSPMFTAVRFGKWNDILNEKVVDTLKFTPVIQHFARGIAFARTKQLTDALNELELVKTKMNDPALKEPFAPFNAAYDAALIAESILAGVIAEEQKDYKNAILYFQKAVTAEDNLIYDEPRDWLLPARQYLGNVLLKTGKYNEAIEVFNKDLTINPNNGWDLSGLSKAYDKLNKKEMASNTKKRLQDAWKIKDVEIPASVF